MKDGGRISVGFVFTNFNNSQLTLQALQSIFDANALVDSVAVVVDNASERQQVEMLRAAESRYPEARFIYSESNEGYFPGLNRGLRFLQQSSPPFDFVVIGNNDLVFPEAFFENLVREADRLAKYPVISPDLVTLDGVHQNPHVISGISRFREIAWDLYFTNYWLSLLIKHVASVGRRLLERKDFEQHREPMFVEQGYGACYVLTRTFFREFGELWAPAFLMGEEFFLSRQLAARGWKVFYDPVLLVVHHDHATVSKVASRKMWEYTKESHRVYRRFVSPYRPTMDNGKKWDSLSAHQGSRNDAA